MLNLNKIWTVSNPEIEKSLAISRAEDFYLNIRTGSTYIRFENRQISEELRNFMINYNRKSTISIYESAVAY